MMNLAGVVGKRFDQIPLVAEGVAEHHDLAIGFQARFFQKLNFSQFEPGIVTVKTIGFQNEENPSSGLIPMDADWLAESVMARSSQFHGCLENDHPPLGGEAVFGEPGSAST
jgi:hypothetical protein